MTCMFVKMFSNQHHNVIVSRQDDGEFDLVSKVRMSEMSTNSQNSVMVDESFLNLFILAFLC